MEFLSIIDTLVATQASIEEVQQRTIASSAYPSRIDQDWEKHIEEDDETFIWWTSEKVKKLKGTSEKEADSSRITQQRRNCYPQQEVRQSNQDHHGINSGHQLRKNKQNSNKSSNRPRNNFRRQQKFGDAPEHLMYTERDTREYNNNNKYYTGNLTKAVGGGRCSECHRQGHSSDQCLRRLHCDYSNRKFHTAQTCRERIANKRQQDLIKAVQTSTQETLAAVRSYHQTQYINPGLQQVRTAQNTGTYNPQNLMQPYLGNILPIYSYQQNGW